MAQRTSDCARVMPSIPLAEVAVCADAVPPSRSRLRLLLPAIGKAPAASSPPPPPPPPVPTMTPPPRPARGPDPSTATSTARPVPVAPPLLLPLPPPPPPPAPPAASADAPMAASAPPSPVSAPPVRPKPVERRWPARDLVWGDESQIKQHGNTRTRKVRTEASVSIHNSQHHSPCGLACGDDRREASQLGHPGVHCRLQHHPNRQRCRFQRLPPAPGCPLPGQGRR